MSPKTQTMYSNYVFIGVAVWTVLTVITRTSAEMFSSIAQMETMVITEESLSTRLQLFITAQENRLEIINRYLNRLEDLAADADQYGILHPAAAFLHSVALSTELDDLMSSLATLKAVESERESVIKFRGKAMLPDKTDLTGAIVAIARLQEIYKLDASQFADGNLAESRVADHNQPTLSATDCYIIGSQLFAAESYDTGSGWFGLVIDKCLDGSGIKEDCPVEMIATAMARYSYQYYLAGDVTAAVIQAAEAVTYDENCLEALDYLKKYFEPIMDDSEEDNSSAEEAMSEAEFDEWQRNLKETDPKTYYATYERGHYSNLCRGDATTFGRDAQIEKKLHCTVTTNGDPFLLIQPVWVEELDKNPEIKLFRNFATSREVDHLIPLGLKTLNTAQVLRLDNITDDALDAYNLRSVTHARSAKNTWIAHSHDSVTAAVARRAEAAIGLSLRDGSGEPLQLANYGIGGHYDPHFDFFSANHTKRIAEKTPTDERAATFMLYLSDVEAGGATTFVHRNLTVWPKKGDALFWYNLHRDGHGHLETLHAGCPVLLGSKWVMNLWVKAAGQELIRPCLNASDSYSP